MLVRKAVNSTTVSTKMGRTVLIDEGSNHDLCHENGDVLNEKTLKSLEL